MRPDSDPAAGSTGAHEQLLRLGVIVRDGAPLGCPGHLRVSIGTPDENDAFLSARAQLARPVTRETQTRTDTDMMIVMQEGATEEQVRHVVERIEQAGARAHPSVGEFVTVIGAIGDDRALVASLQLEGEPGVEKVVPILKPYKLVSSDFRGSRRRRGDRRPADRRRRLRADRRAPAPSSRASRRSPPRGPARRPAPRRCAAAPTSRARRRTRSRASGKPGLEILAEAREETGLPIVTELMDVRQLEDVLEVADMIQLGARNMQNFDLLREVGRTSVPVLLKRGLSATIEEWLLSAEYIAREGNVDIVLCERGIRTFETATR